MMIGKAVAVGLFVAAMAGNAIAAVNSAPADFIGRWRIGQWIGESQGGVSNPAPDTLLGKTVQITGAMIRTPERTCRLHDAALRVTPNSEIEASFWGGQRIAQLRLPKRDIASAFGREQTRVFQDKSLCISAVLIDHDHMIDAFGSGVIYRLDRVK